MEEDLLLVILAEENDDDDIIEQIIINNVLINRDLGIEVNNLAFDLDEMAEEEVRENFRFDREHIYRLVEVLGLPERVITDTQNNVNSKYICFIYFVYFLANLILLY